MTLSPEYDSSMEFIQSVTDHGIVVGIGHTCASPEQIRGAVRAGARLSTHLGNGCHTMLPRHRNYLWAQLAEQRLFASMIVDGHHLPPMVVRTMVRAKGVARSILISDLSGLAGLPPGKYASNLCDLEILENGKIVIAGQSELLAAASFPIGQGIANVIGFAQVDLEQAIRMATVNPAELLGLPEPRLQPGATADLVLFDVEPSRLVEETVHLGEMRVRQTVISGKTVYRSD
jgi:N-acetylglucosamine-6-phosphate deacetylase